MTEEHDCQIELKFNNYKLLNGVYHPVKMNNQLFTFVNHLIDTTHLPQLNNGYIIYTLLHKIFMKYIHIYQLYDKKNNSFFPNGFFNSCFYDTIRHIKFESDHIKLFYMDKIFNMNSTSVPSDLLTNDFKASLVSEAYLIDKQI